MIVLVPSIQQTFEIEFVTRTKFYIITEWRSRSFVLQLSLHRSIDRSVGWCEMDEESVKMA